MPPEGVGGQRPCSLGFARRAHGQRGHGHGWSPTPSLPAPGHKGGCFQGGGEGKRVRWGGMGGWTLPPSRGLLAPFFVLQSNFRWLDLEACTIFFLLSRRRHRGNQGLPAPGEGRWLRQRCHAHHNGVVCGQGGQVALGRNAAPKVVSWPFQGGEGREGEMEGRQLVHFAGLGSLEALLSLPGAPRFRVKHAPATRRVCLQRRCRDNGEVVQGKARRRGGVDGNIV